MFAQSIDGGKSLIENEQFLQSMDIDFENVVYKNNKNLIYFYVK